VPTKSNENDSRVGFVVNGDHEPIFDPRYVENDAAVLENARSFVLLFYLRRRMPGDSLCLGVPCF
jgi:hypothetical protein